MNNILIMLCQHCKHVSVCACACLCVCDFDCLNLVLQRAAVLLTSLRAVSFTDEQSHAKISHQSTRSNAFTHSHTNIYTLIFDNLPQTYFFSFIYLLSLSMDTFTLFLHIGVSKFFFKEIYTFSKDALIKSDSKDHFK